MTDVEKCLMCGKRAKRPCPATGKFICAACCGANRGSKLNCPSECGFFPFGVAGKELWQSVSQSWAAKSMHFLDRQLGEKTMAGMFQRFLPPSRARRQEDVLAAYFPVVYHGLLVHRDAEGKTGVDRWEAEGWTGLNNDEKVMMSHRRHSCVTVIESQRRIDEHFVECIDLFETERKPFRIVEPLTPSSMPRFTRLLAWLTHYRELSRIGAVGFQIAELLWPQFLELIDQRLGEEQKSRPDLTRKQFLAEHLPDCAAWMEMLAQEARKRVIESMGMRESRPGAELVRESIAELGERFSQREKLSKTRAQGAGIRSEHAQGTGTSPDAPTAEQIAAAHRARFEKLLEEPNQALNGLTPRAAALEPDLRPKLVDWLKWQIHHVDAVNHRDGLRLDLDWALDALGVPELKLAPAVP